MDWQKEAYRILKEFLYTAEISNKEFAIRAGIPPTTFQSMLTKESKMKVENYVKIRNTMYDYFGDAHWNSGSVAFGNDTPEAHRSDKMGCLAQEFEFLGYEDNFLPEGFSFNDSREDDDSLGEHMSRLLPRLPKGFSWQIETILLENGKSLEVDALEAIRELNEEGKKAAIEQINLLAQIPKYQKQIKKIPPENGQDDN